MAWIHLDDTFDSHPKVMKAGNAAVGLFVRVLGYSNRLLTDGVVPGEIVAGYGTRPQADKLVKVRLLHRAGHECLRCPQPPDGDYVVHDYFDYNKSRAKVTADRAAEAKKKRDQRTGGRPTQGGSVVDSGSIPSGNESVSSSNRTRKEEETNSFPSRFSRNAAAQGQTSPGDSGPRARESQSKPIPPPPTEGEKASQLEVPGELCGPSIPEACATLVDAISAAGVTIGWSLTSEQWYAAERHLKRCGLAALVERSISVWNRPGGRPQSAGYLIRCWDDLPNLPRDAAGAPISTTPQQPGRQAQPPRSTTDSRINDGLGLMARMALLDAAEAAAEAGTQPPSNVFQLPAREITA